MERDACQVRKVHVSGCCRVRIIRSATARLTITTGEGSGHNEIATRYEDDTLFVRSLNPGTAVPRFGHLAIPGKSYAGAGGDIRVHGNPLDGRSAPAGTEDRPGITPLVDIALQAVTRIHLAGPGEVLLQGLDQRELAIQLTGSGHIVADGRIGYLRIAIDGTGHVDASRLRAWGASLHLVGSGAIRAHATGAAMARLNGPGNIVIFGNPPLRDSHANDSGGDIHYR